MPPFAGSMNPSQDSHEPKLESNSIITINVGGQLFQTTKQTLTLAGPKSFLSTISDDRSFSFSSSQPHVPFFDRDPELFSIFLSLLRTGNLPSTAKAFDLQDLIFEAHFYGIESVLLNSISNPSQFEPFTLEKSMLLPLNGRETPSSISTTPFGSVHVAHGSKITSFDWSLTQKWTVLTRFAAVDSLVALSPVLAAAGATDFSGLQIIDLQKGFVRKSLDWDNLTKSGSTVQAIGKSNEFLFTSFESSRRNSNSVMVYDLLGDFRPVIEIAQNEIYGAEIDSAVPATKLNWVSSYNLLMTSGFHSGPSGVSGNIKLWDIKSGKVAWEVKENVDCFSDVTVSDNLSAMFKVGVNSGEVFFIDLRSLSSDKSWVCLGDDRKMMNVKKEGLGCKIENHGNQVFCSKGGDLELWSEVLVDASTKTQDWLGDRVFRRNLMGKSKDRGGSKITNLSFGGNKMFITRKDEQFVEVWQSSARGF